MTVPEQEITPIKLTAKDRALFKELFDNASKSYSEIAKKVNLSKEAVAYRIQRLEEKKLVVGYNTIIDIQTLGWSLYYAYFTLENIDTEQEKIITDFLKKHNHIAQIFNCIGNYDLIIKIVAKNHTQADDICKDIEGHFKQIASYSIDHIDQEHAVPFSFFFDSAPEELHSLGTISKKAQNISSLDKKILKTIAKNARLSISDIARTLKQPRELVRYHLKKLEKDKIIVKYRPDTLPKLLGYNWYFLRLKIGKWNDSLKRSLETYLLNHPNVTFFYHSTGNADIQIELRVKTTTKLNEILLEIRGLLKKVLKRHELLLILDEPKFTYFPKCLEN